MNIKKVVVTGEAFFLYRYKPLFNALSCHFEHLEYLEHGTLNQTRKLQKIKTLLPKFIIEPAEKLLRKNKQTYINKSQETEKKIRQLEIPPDLVFHVFGLYSPFWDKFDIPYVFYLDYTMALAAKKWPAWAPFSNQKDLNFWLECERKAYQHAHHLFPMSNLVKESLTKDYGIAPEKITVVGSSGNFEAPYQAEKTFGSKQILFNGSDFERKGGDLVVAAFKEVRKQIPDAKLIIIGKKVAINEPGIENPGRISSHEQMRNLFLSTDLVVAPSYCEPFQEFLLEAMNYGVPCIVSSNDGMPEIIDHHLNGIVLDQLKPDLIAEQIVKLLNDVPTLTLMSERARYKVKTQFNWDDIAMNIVKALANS